MSQDTPAHAHGAEPRSTPCHYSAAGHMLHPIQFKLAFRAGEPVPMEIVGEHETGFLVAPPDDPSHVEVWCMHERWRAVVRDALARGVTSLLSWQHGLARVEEEYISHSKPEWWRECPADDELTPLERGFVSKDALLRALGQAAIANGLRPITPDAQEP